MKVLATTVAVLAVALSLAGAAHAQKQTRPTWLPEIWWKIAWCETHANWRHDSGTYQGAFGMYHGTWDTYRLPGYPAEAYNATPRQQYAVARRVAANHTLNAWGCYRNRLL